MEIEINKNSYGQTIHLRPKVLNGLLGLFAQFPSIQRVILFGSRARGTHRVGSDIDLALVGESVSAIRAKLNWQIDDLGFLETFDLVIMDETLEDRFRQRIEKEGVLIYEATNPQ